VSRCLVGHSNHVDALSQESYIASFAQLPNLTYLTLCFDLEKEANDRMELSHDLAWYNRSIHRRLHVSELLAKQCLVLERINWVQMGIDSGGNEMCHRFVVEDTPSSGRVVKAVAVWWMAAEFKDEHGGPLPVIVEKSSYFG
jgi:hypothetical protein